eukprot:m.125832 g.125832  ORF g.125832 m.125832 type:complete len:382 (-) comp14501_c1_seq2:23-1168(-)
MQHFKNHQFTLERYFAKYEFTAKHLLCCSDCEAITLEKLLALADDETKNLWAKLSLGYTESQGLPLLRSEVAKIYQSEGVVEDNVLIAAPQELILIGISQLLNAGDHCIVTSPGYQSLYETALACDAEVSYLNVVADDFDLLSQVKSLLKENTKLIVVNFPHNPTGYMPTQKEYKDLFAFADENKIRIFSDEMYRFLEYKNEDRLPSGCEISNTAVTLCGLSKSFGLPGLRLGWLVSQDKSFIEKAATLKDFTTICAPAPSEVLAIIAIRARETLFAKNKEIIVKNVELLEDFFKKHSKLFTWTRPKGGSVAFPTLSHDLPININEFCEKAVNEAGVLLLPCTVYGLNVNNGGFRIGLGRKDLPECLTVFSEWLQKLNIAK